MPHPSCDMLYWMLNAQLSSASVCTSQKTQSQLYRVILSLEAPNKFGKSIPEFGKTHSSVLGCERRPVSASIMSRPCFASFFHFHFSFSSHYLNNIIFIDNSLGHLATESPRINCFNDLGACCPMTMGSRVQLKSLTREYIQTSPTCFNTG